MHKGERGLCLRILNGQSQEGCFTVYANAMEKTTEDKSEVSPEFRRPHTGRASIQRERENQMRGTRDGESERYLEIEIECVCVCV